MECEWDPAKAASNFRKHGVPFEEAETVFDDPRVIVRYDERHSDREDRWAVIGISNRGRVVIVTYTPRNRKPRLVSARKATRREVDEYGESDD